MNKPELLAPAGDYKSFIAAIEAGADAVYFGGKYFSARASAINFSREEICQALDYAHLRGRKCYAAVNILIKDEEFERLFDFVNFLYKEGIDALIVQDLGVYDFCRKHWPDLALHASTQMAAHNLNDVLVLEKMGFKRVVLARELTIEEIKEIKAKTKIELEVFIHGALCFSYSGRCLMSSMIGGRSGNRGRCAQPCRRKYNVCDQRGVKKTGIEGYLLSTRDLCTIDILDKLQFIDSLKIEGRMKGAEYVGAAAEKYRRHIDAAANGEKPDWERDKKEMAAIFNRGGFSHGYLLDRKPDDIVASERSKNFGVKVGKVIEARNGFIKIKTEDTEANDGLEIWGREGQEKNFGFRVEKVKDGIIEIQTDRNIGVGDKVYKTFDYKLNKKLFSHIGKNILKSIPAMMAFEAEAKKPIRLTINGITIKGSNAEAAERMETKEETIKDQLAKLGGTPFFVEKIEINLKGSLNIPLKNINDVRRRGIEKLTEKIVRSFKRTEKFYSAECFAPKKIGVRNICIQSDDPFVLEALAGKRIKRIYTALKIDIKKFYKAGIEIFQALPAFWRKGEKLEIFQNYDGFLVPSLGNLEILSPKSKKVADFSLNVFNNYAARQSKNMGFSGFTVSVENNLAEMNNINSAEMEKEAIVYGYLPLMTSEHCVLFKTEYCRRKNIALQDETGAEFPVFSDCAVCRMRILNSAPLHFTDINKISADNVRLIHTIETAEKFIAIVDNYLGNDFGSKANTTTGHFYRGVE